MYYIYIAKRSIKI